MMVFMDSILEKLVELYDWTQADRDLADGLYATKWNLWYSYILY